MNDSNRFQIIPLEGEPVPVSRGRGVRAVIYWTMALVVIFAISGLVWFLWGGVSSFTEKNVEFSIETSGEVTSGGKADYLVKFENKTPQALTDIRLSFFYPKDAVVIREGEQVSSPLTEEVKIERIEPGGAGQYKFSAYLVGGRGEVKKATARLIFTPEEIRSSFEKEADAATTINALDVALTLVAPPNAVSGQAISYLLDYRNESSKDLTNLTLKFVYPDGFTPTRFNPSPASGNATWLIKQVKPGEGNRIVIDGLLKGAERENKSIVAFLQREIDGVAIDYEKATSATTISTPLLSTDISVNNKPNGYIAQLGEQLNYQIKFINNSEVDLAGLTISAKLDGTMFDLNSLRTSGFFDAGARTVSWNASSSALLNRLAPGQYGAVDFTVNLKNTFPTSGLGAKDLVAKVGVKAETFTIPPGYFSDSLMAQTESITKIKSLPGFEQLAQYSAGGLDGNGPVPPRSGQKTVYTIVWRLSNTAGDILKTVMKGVLPVGVEWENNARVSGQQSLPSFKSASREIVWDVGVVPSGTGSTAPKYETVFQISITPSSAQAGTIPTLIKNLILEGEDGATRQLFVLSGKDLNANDLTDRPNQGMVEE